MRHTAAVLLAALAVSTGAPKLFRSGGAAAEIVETTLRVRNKWKDVGS